AGSAGSAAALARLAVRPLRNAAARAGAAAQRGRACAGRDRPRRPQPQGSAGRAVPPQSLAEGFAMTYCVGIKLDAGLVFLSDSRTNAGLDQISTFRKMMVYEKAGDRFMVMLSAGNLS